MHNIEYIVRVGCRTYYERLSPRFLWTFLFYIFLGVFTHAPPGVIYVTTPFLLPSFYFSLYLIKYYTATRILCFPRATTVAQWYYILYRYNHNYKDTAATLKKIYTIYIMYIYRWVRAYDIVSIILLLLLLFTTIIIIDVHWQWLWRREKQWDGKTQVYYIHISTI